MAGAALWNLAPFGLGRRCGPSMVRLLSQRVFALAWSVVLASLVSARMTALPGGCGGCHVAAWSKELAYPVATAWPLLFRGAFGVVATTTAVCSRQVGGAAPLAATALILADAYAVVMGNPVAGGRAGLRAGGPASGSGVGALGGETRCGWLVVWVRCCCWRSRNDARTARLASGVRCVVGDQGATLGCCADRGHGDARWRQLFIAGAACAAVGPRWLMDRHLEPSLLRFTRRGQAAALAAVLLARPPGRLRCPWR